MIHLSLCLIIRIPCSSAAFSTLCQSEQSLLWTAPSVGIALPYRKKRLKRKIPPPNPTATRIACPLGLWREMMGMGSGASAACLWNLLGKTPASLGSPVSSASSKIRSATCLLSVLQVWADTRKETLCTSHRFLWFPSPDLPCHAGCSQQQSAKGWQGLCLLETEEVEVAGDAEQLWGACGTCPLHTDSWRRATGAAGL